MMFWVLCLLIILTVAVPLVWKVVRHRSAVKDAAEFDIAVYRDQLRDVDRDLERGVMTEDSAERTRLEISRRILDADRARQAGETRSAPAALNWIAGGATVVFLLVGTGLTYQWLGAPGYEDLPLAERIERAEELRANRPAQAEAEARMPATPEPAAEAEYLALVERLRTAVAQRPDDPRGLQLLAQNEANLGNFTAAHQAQGQLLDLVGDQAPASAYAEWAEFQVMAAGGYVSPEAEAALVTALERDPDDGAARYYWGLMRAQTGRPDLAFNVWRSLLENSRPDAPWVPAIRAEILQMAALAGQQYDLPDTALPAPALSGPTADDMAAASDMAPEDRQAMIEGMVEGLAERLATEGGGPAEWARLITALGVLGQSERAQGILDEARQVFDGQSAALTLLNEAAHRSGLR